jgi:starch synthase
MPSQYEPCGLGQLISLRYGTVPIVRKTGGLADTITEFQPATMEGNGVVFTDYTSKALVKAFGRCRDIYAQQEAFKRLSEKCMTYDFSWQESAKQYKEMYEAL